MPLILALRRQRQADLHEFKASLVCTASSGTGSKATEKPFFEKQNKQTNKFKLCVYTCAFVCVCVCVYLDAGTLGIQSLAAGAVGGCEPPSVVLGTRLRSPARTVRAL